VSFAFAFSSVENQLRSSFDSSSTQRRAGGQNGPHFCLERCPEDYVSIGGSLGRKA